MILLVLVGMPTGLELVALDDRFGKPLWCHEGVGGSHPLLDLEPARFADPLPDLDAHPPGAPEPVARRYRLGIGGDDRLCCFLRKLDTQARGLRVGEDEVL